MKRNVGRCLFCSPYIRYPPDVPLAPTLSAILRTLLRLSLRVLPTSRPIRLPSRALGRSIVPPALTAVRRADSSHSCDPPARTFSTRGRVRDARLPLPNVQPGRFPSAQV